MWFSSSFTRAVFFIYLKNKKKHKNYLKFPDEIRRCSNNNNNIVGNVLEFQL